MGYLWKTGRGGHGRGGHGRCQRCEGEEDEEPLIAVTLTHFVQGRSPLNPFPEALPQRKVPDNLHERNNRQGHSSRHAFSAGAIPGERSPKSTDLQERKLLQLMLFSYLGGPKTQIKKFVIEAMIAASSNPPISASACTVSYGRL